MQTSLVLVLLYVVLCWAGKGSDVFGGGKGDIFCKKGKLSKKINVGEGDWFYFSTHNLESRTYEPNTKCFATYKKKASCPEMRFSCYEFNINNKRKNCKGKDAMQVQANGKKKFYCKRNGPDVTTTGKTLKVSFLSDRKKQSSGAVCTLECVTPVETTVRPPLTENPGPPSDCQCGLAKRRTKIVGGIETEVNEYPWQAGLIWDPYSTSAFYCGGSLISNGWILSDAHCTQGTDASEWHASLGDHDYESSTESNHINLDIALILDHPNYDDDTTNFDFTLLKMKNTIDISLHPHIRPICLPINDENSYDNFPATVTGWGTISSGGPDSNKLLEVNVNVLSNTECKNDYYYDPEEITEQMICANVDGGGKDACQGDSGGPLVTSGSGNGMVPGQNYELIGVVSWGIGCASSSFPGVYARVTKQLDWIKETTSEGWYTCPRN